MRKTLFAALAALTSLGAPASAPAAPLSVLDSFRIGNSGTVYCSAQNVATDQALGGMFDSGYSVTCRDAALPVGKLYKLRDPGQARQRLAAIRGGNADCGAPHQANVPDIGAVDVLDCRLKDANVGYRAYQLAKGNLLYVAEGLTGYDSALQLGLRSLVADRPVKGEVSIATTGAGDPRPSPGFRPGRSIRACARGGLSAQQCRQLCRGGGILRRGEPVLAKARSADRRRWPTKLCRSRTSAATPKRNRCSSARPSSSATTRSSRAGCATIERSTNSTRVAPTRRCKELDKPMPKAGRRG